MKDTSSNSVWIDADCFDGFELSRPQLFREETRPLFYKYFRISPTDDILEAGCGTGVLTRFIAKGISTGKITGFDISQKFVDYGNQRIADESLTDKAIIVLGDGYNLSYHDNIFDAVISHNYLSVLSDPEEGLKELIRVCRPGGNVSVSTGVSASNGTGAGYFWEGEYPLEGMPRLMELMERYNRAYKAVVTTSSLKQSNEWPSVKFPKLFSKCGLQNISIMPVASSFAYNDNYWSEEYRRKKITASLNDEIRIIVENSKDEKFSTNGFSNDDCLELVSLLRMKQQYLLDNLKTDDSWEWSAGLSFIVTGTKPLP